MQRSTGISFINAIKTRLVSLLIIRQFLISGSMLIKFVVVVCMSLVGYMMSFMKIKMEYTSFIARINVLTSVIICGVLRSEKWTINLFAFIENSWHFDANYLILCSPVL